MDNRMIRICEDELESHSCYQKDQTSPTRTLCVGNVTLVSKKVDFYIEEDLCREEV